MSPDRFDGIACLDFDDFRRRCCWVGTTVANHIFGRDIIDRAVINGCSDSVADGVSR